MKKENINPGDFNEQITWQAPTAAKDSFGQNKRTFADYKVDWVGVAPLTINEAEISNRLQYTETYVFTAHYDSAINNKYQLQYNGDDYNIKKLEILNLKRFLRVTATKIEE
jgi:SPP1 family predicted phage head-tail adaptor